MNDDFVGSHSIVKVLLLVVSGDLDASSHVKN